MRRLLLTLFTSYCIKRNIIITPTLTLPLTQALRITWYARHRIVDHTVIDRTVQTLSGQCTKHAPGILHVQQPLPTNFVGRTLILVELRATLTAGVP